MTSTRFHLTWHSMAALTASGDMVRRKPRGFTLIELLVVMAIIGTLLSVVVPRYFKSLEHAREIALKQDLSVMREAITHFRNDLNRYPESLNELVDRRYLKKLPVDPVTESMQTWIGVPSPDTSQTGLYDIISGAPGSASDGTPYSAF